MARRVLWPIWILLAAGCLDGRGTIMVEGEGPGGRPGRPDEDPDGYGDGDSDSDIDLGDGDADSDGDSDADADADSDADSDADADTDGDVVDEPGACVYPEGPYGSQPDDVAPDFARPLPACGGGGDSTLNTFCDAPAIVLHFNSPG